MFIMCVISQGIENMKTNIECYDVIVQLKLKQSHT